MRIVAGTLKGRRLASPNWSGVRPTSDRVRETLFDLLGYHVEGARFLDACAGTGAVGIEALSRGAAYAAFVDCDRRSTGLVEKNLSVCRVSDRAVVVRTALPEGVTRPELAEPFDVIVADPPTVTRRSMPYCLRSPAAWRTQDCSSSSETRARRRRIFLGYSSSAR